MQRQAIMVGMSVPVIDQSSMSDRSSANNALQRVAFLEAQGPRETAHAWEEHFRACIA
jgi:hypothetical protein